jgi:hypothetical protein
MEELWLVCEGEPESVDVTILRSVFTTVLPAEIVVEPACGSSPSVVARFLARRGGRAAYLQDRDYRPRTDAESAFSDGRPGFLWRRHSIENYLLPPPIILHAFQRLRERFERLRPGRLPAWFGALPADVDQVADVLQQCAQRRAAEEASRLATHRLWTALPSSIGHVQRRNPTRPTLPDPLGPDDWREALCQEVERVRQAAVGIAGAAEFGREAVIIWFDSAYGEVTGAAYLASLEFLIDFHGRDLLTEFQQWLSSRSVQLSYNLLLTELIPAAVEEYTTNRAVYGSDDFRDLANGVRALAGLPPVE